jgi:hypothetical protein
LPTQVPQTEEEEEKKYYKKIIRVFFEFGRDLKIQRKKSESALWKGGGGWVRERDITLSLMTLDIIVNS